MVRSLLLRVARYGDMPDNDSKCHQQQQQRVAVGPGNAQFISIRQVSSDAATLQRGTVLQTSLSLTV